MKLIFLSLICYDLLYEKEISLHKDDPDYFDKEIVAHHSDPIHKWCKMLNMQGLNTELWYLSSFSKTSKSFIHKYGHPIRKIPGFNLKNYSTRHFDCDFSFQLFKELKREKITHMLVLPYLMNELLPIDTFDILTLYCNKHKLKLFPVHGGSTITQYGFIKKKLKSYLLKKVDGLICTGTAEYNIMINEFNYPTNKIHSFLNPLDMENFYPIAKKDSANFLNIDADLEYLVYAGRFVSTKGIQNLINIIPELMAQHPKIRLLLLGRGPYQNELISLIKYLRIDDAVKIIGEVPNDILKYYYSIASALVLPSYTEGTPNVLLEAIACNTICIASNVGSIADILGNGIGIMIPPKDESAILNAIYKALTGQFHINQKAREELLKEISLDNKGKQLKQILLIN